MWLGLFFAVILAGLAFAEGDDLTRVGPVGLYPNFLLDSEAIDMLLALRRYIKGF